VASDVTAPAEPTRPEPTRPESTRKSRTSRTASTQNDGVRYPRWFWPSFAIPGLIWLLVFFVVPLYTVVSVAFGTVDPIFRGPIPVYEPWWWTTESFEQVIGRFVGPASFWQPVLLRTFVFVAVSSVICLVLGYAVAYFVARYGGKWKALLLVLLISPFWISYLMRIFAWQSLLADDGWVNVILEKLHVISDPISWLSGRPITVIMALVYGYIPYMILVLFGQLDRINESLLEAGRDLGASPARTFFRVTLPLSKQAILAGIIIVSLPMFGDYYTNDLMGGPSTRMYGNLIDRAIGQAGQGPRAGALVILLMLFLLIPMAYYMRSTKEAAQTR
jgi:spermidine/putrescine transport system permease protein